MAICGVVLCGGASRRMGSDKALLSFKSSKPDDSRTWAGRACDTLASAGLPVALSIRAAQRDEYAARFPERTLIVDDGRIPGPLGALLSVYRAKRDALFVLAADMPFVSGRTVQLLLARFESRALEEDCGGVCFGDERRIDPLCAVYAADALARLDAQAAQLPRRDLQQLRDFLRLRVLSPTSGQRNELRNLNTPEDLRDFEAPR